MERRRRFDRYQILITVILAVILAIVFKLVQMQIVQGNEYRTRSEKTLVRSLPIPAPRGEVFDRYGRPLITNRNGYNITFQKQYIPKGGLNALVLDMIRVMQQHDQSYIDNLPITKEEPFEFLFADASYDNIEEKTVAFLKKCKLEEGADATDALHYFIDRYDIDSGYSMAEKRLIAGVRYEMENSVFSDRYPYTFAEDVSLDVVTWIKEQQSLFQGVNIDVAPIRQLETDLAAHILGRVGRIYKEEYDELKDKNYGMNDMIGKDGIEKVLEEYLRGTDGMRSIEQNVDGKITSLIDQVDPKPGHYAVLTIDLELQRVLEESLARVIPSLRSRPDSHDADAGSAVVVDVNSGEVLAMASYPTFNLETFNEDYSELYKNPDKPMWNRAISGIYAPGSTFKILTSIAGLESGTVDTKEQIRDEGIYRFYKDYQPGCWIYLDGYGTHGLQNVSQAIENSCNYYFYDVGRRMGIDTLVEYGKKFGLGEFTGLEISGESKGVFASPEYKKKTFDEIWYPGDTLQASIGQSYHLFTPAQLANYTATVANGGTRYALHLVKDIKSYETAESVKSTEPQVVERIDMSEENYNAVKDGMRKVTETGTASNVFANFLVPIGGKTGTASVSRGSATGVFIGFAPFDEPQIAMAVVVEHGGHGNYVAEIVRDVFEAYFQTVPVEDTIAPYYERMR